ncbi:hypothetical protein J6S55_00180 [Candidatus Saccharibacteria bacterium]|nr:hypothetical protein [Candidatus Saccharibacteria bacterium]
MTAKFQIKLPLDIIEDFRKEINQDDFLLLENESPIFHDGATYKKHYNTICACMDRIQDTAKYLNEKPLGEQHDYGCAFDFIEFISHSATMLDCINSLADIFSCKEKFNLDTEFFKSKNVFRPEELKYKLKSGKNNDDRYFEYIRTISSIHPNDTKRHKAFQHTDKEVSPFVIWNKFAGLDKENSGDILLRIYDKGEKVEIYNLNLYLSEIINYIKDRYSHLIIIQDTIRRIKEERINSLKISPIKNPKEFKNYSIYLNNLSKEAAKRDGYASEDIKQLAKMVNIETIPAKNNQKFKKYKNAIKFAIKKLHSALEEMDSEKIRKSVQLLRSLDLPNLEEEDAGLSCSYNYEKIRKLYYEDDTWSRQLASHMSDIFNKYVSVNDEEFFSLAPLQLLATINTALYFYSLKHDTVTNRQIPKTKQYR